MHTRNGPKRDQCDDKRILDQILAVFLFKHLLHEQIGAKQQWIHVSGSSLELLFRDDLLEICARHSATNSDRKRTNPISRLVNLF